VFDKKAEKLLRSVLNIVYYIHKLFTRTLNRFTQMLVEGTHTGGIYEEEH
jgi:hypothetical protein